MLSQPVRAHVLVLLLFGLITLIGAWLALGTYTRTETARGILVTSDASAKMVAIRPGQVVELLVREGDMVRAGQRLATIRTEQADDVGGSTIGDSLAALEAQRLLAGQQEGAAGRRADSERARLNATLAGLAQQRTDIGAQIAMQEEAVASARDMFDRVNKLLDSGFISLVEVERRRQAWITARQHLAQMQQQLNALGAQGREASAALSRVSADADSEINAARVSAETVVQQRAQLRGARAYAIVAPISGRVAALQTALGRTVEPSVPLMEIIPEGSPLQAHIYVPTRAIGFVRPGQEVRLLYDAFPYQRFGSFNGRIVGVARTVIDPRQLAVPMHFEEPVYRVDVAPQAQTVGAFGERQPLQPGMTLTASLILDRRSFSNWLLQPLNAVLRRNQS